MQLQLHRKLKSRVLLCSSNCTERIDAYALLLYSLRCNGCMPAKRSCWVEVMKLKDARHPSDE